MKLRNLVAGVAALIAVAGSTRSAWAVFITCTPIGVDSITADASGATNRVHVECSAPTNDGGNNITFYAMPVKDAAAANRFLSLATTAITTGRTLAIEFTPGKSTDLTGANFGCAAGNCRYVTSLVLR